MKTNAIRYYDSVKGQPGWAQTEMITNDGLVTGDWSKGPEGTGEAAWKYNMFPARNLLAGCLAESWELKPDANTVVFHIRKGVHFALNPKSEASRLVNGRELTADDVAFSIIRMWKTPGSSHYNEYPRDTHIESVTATDKYTVVIKTLPGKLGPVWEYAADRLKVWPREVVEKYGDLTKWENSVGTGPFILVDNVPMSVATLVRNPNYRMKKPLHPEDQLPYLDGVRIVIIQDLSTQLAALRTGKVDQTAAVETLIRWEDVKGLIKTNPEIKYSWEVNLSPWCINWRLDLPDKPWNDKRVRYALSMAVNREAIRDQFYAGGAEIYLWPIPPIPEFKSMFTPLEQLPQSVQDQFTYNPDKAKQLLAEAGYPKGFKTEVVVDQSRVDLLTIIKEDWAKIGVDMAIDLRDNVIFTNLITAGTFKEMCAYYSPVEPFRFMNTKPGASSNRSKVNDPVITKAIEAIDAAYWDEAKRAQLMKEMGAYILEQAYLLQLPTPYVYTVWQPWVREYSGESYIGFSASQRTTFTKYVWYDQELKKQILGAR